MKSDTLSTLPVGTFQDFQEMIQSQRQQHWVRPETAAHLFSGLLKDVTLGSSGPGGYMEE